jgi:hypothetical protein
MRETDMPWTSPLIAEARSTRGPMMQWKSKTFSYQSIAARMSGTVIPT